VYIEFISQILSTPQSVDFTLLVAAPYARKSQRLHRLGATSDFSCANELDYSESLLVGTWNMVDCCDPRGCNSCSPVHVGSPALVSTHRPTLDQSFLHTALCELVVVQRCCE